MKLRFVLLTVLSLLLVFPTIAAGQNGWTDGGTNVYLTTSSDKVGIGVTNPGDYKLYVDGYFKASGIRTELVSGYVNVIGGHSSNSVAANEWGVTISGGGASSGAS